MSIKCSLLGHSFGETTVEREREEEGTEVVITITEMETCSRCGETRVVSENKEVTTLETPGDDGASPETATGDTSGASDAADEFASTATTDADEEGDATGGTDAVILEDDGGAESSAQAQARGAETAIPDAESDATGERPSDEEDAVIIDAEGDDRDPGEWPEEDGDPEPPSDEGGTEDDSDRDPGEWPEEPTDPAERAGEADEVEILGDSSDAAGAADAPADGGPAETDATPVDDGTGATSAEAADAGGAADGRSAGAWPEEESPSVGSDAMGEWPEETKRDEPADSDITGPSLDGDEGHSITVPEGMFKCSECGFTTEAESSSLRAGDFCPECHRGTLRQREDEAAAEE